MSDSYKIPRNDTFLGKKLQFGESSKNKPIRLSKHKGTWKRDVHEVWHDTGSVGTLKHALVHKSPDSLASFIRKIDLYSTKNAQALYKKGVSAKWYHILLYPKAKFIKNYVYYQGFRDGTHGFVHAMAMSLHSFLTRAKLWHLHDQKSS